MITATISRTKDHLSEYLKVVQAGETLVITDRKKPVARVEAIRASLNHANVTPPRAPWSPDKILNAPMGKMSGEESLVSAVIAERSEGW